MVVHYSCEICGLKGKRVYPNEKVPNHFFCSRECQNKWQKTREDLVAKNKDPEFRKKVSEGLKKRKRVLGDNYHSEETKKKIGMETVKHWESYDPAKKQHMLDVLHQNSQKLRKYGPYDHEWSCLSASIRKNNLCHRCGTKERLVVHHIIPVKMGGSRELRNLVPLCAGCHKTVEVQTNKLYEVIPDWKVIQLLVRERLHLI